MQRHSCTQRCPRCDELKMNQDFAILITALGILFVYFLRSLPLVAAFCILYWLMK